MQIFIFLRNVSLYKEFFLAHVNVFFKKVSLYHYSALLSLLCSDNQIVCHNDAFHIPLKKYHQCITILK